MIGKMINKISYGKNVYDNREIKAVIKSARQIYEYRKIICVFQPHSYSRVRSLMNELHS